MDSIVRREIAEQPDVVARLLADNAAAFERLARDVRAAAPRLVLIAARGSSDNAARYAQHLFGRLCRLPVALATPSLLTVYDTPPVLHDALVIGISQSGASPDIRAVVEDAARQGQPTVAITNEPGSPLAAAAAHVIALGAGVEASVAATKTYTSSLAAIAALAAALADPGGGLQAELRELPGALRDQLDRSGEAAEAAAATASWRRCAVVGRGAHYATAFEAALKVKELTRIAAEPFSPADLMHGPVALLGPDHPLVAIGTSGPALEGIVEAAGAARDRGAPVVALTDCPEAFPAADAALTVAAVPEWLSPIAAVLPAQLLAVCVAERLGVAVDTPFGLSKVTETT